MIPRDTIDRIFSAARIEEVVADYVSLKKRGANLIGLCPFHDEKTGSFTVSPSKGIYKCFGCGKSGHAVGFITEIEQCSYVEALKILAKRYGIQIEERELTKEEQQHQDDRESMFVVNEWSNKWFQNQLWDTQEGKAIGLSYLRDRGLRDDIIHKFQIGYSPDKSLLSVEAKRHGFEEKYLVNDSQNAPYLGTGVCLKSEDGRLYDRFHSRVIFPFFNVSGKVIGFAGRLLKQNDKVGKYVNSPTSPLFEKHDCLYGIFQAKQAIVRLDRCYLVEGQMDVVSMHQAGIENVVASGGTSLTHPQIKLIHRFTNNITVLYDGDKAGIKAALRGIDMILEEGINVKVVLLPEGEDPDSFARGRSSEELMQYLNQNQTDFIRFKTQLLSEEAGNDPLSRSELIKSVVQSISIIPDTITRQVYLKTCSELLDMQENILGREVAKQRRERYLKDHPEQSENKSVSDVQEAKEESAIEVVPAKKTVVKQSMFDENILNLLQMMVRYGERVLYVTEEGQSVGVGEYILSEMQTDAIVPRLREQQQVIDEFLAHYKDEGFIAESFFLHHENAAISHLAVEMIADRKHFIAADGEHLLELVSRLLLELKYTVANERIDQMQSDLESAQKNNDEAAMRDILQYLSQLHEIRRVICQQLGGNRIVTL